MENNANNAGQTRVGELPLFPLPLVLFPYVALPLHIFEERYKELINRCVLESEPFGIVLVNGVDEKTGAVQTCPIGCTARVSRVERLPDGRMNIEVMGEKRFRILDTHEQRAYRTGLTESYDDTPFDEVDAAPLVEDVQKLLREFLTRTLALSGQTGDSIELPDDATILSFMTACALPLKNEEKQTLLDGDDTLARLTQEREVLLREVTRLRRSEESQEETSEEPTVLIYSPITMEQYEDYVSVN